MRTLTRTPVPEGTQLVELFTAQAPLQLAGGATLGPVQVAYETYGTLAEDGSNAIFICHALTGDAHASGVDPQTGRAGWWDTLIGPGKAIDTDRFFVICPNLVGGCQGSTGPSSVDPTTGVPYGMTFPLLQMSDFVTVHRALLDHLGVRRLRAAVGGSLGGMQVLQWATDFPEQLDQAVVIAASSRLTAQNIAFSAVARQAILRDPQFADGHYLEHSDGPRTGMAIARMMAHITYLSEQGLAEKFGRRFQAEESIGGFGVDFAVESYLDHQGSVFLDRFDALSYLYLTRVMDYFDPFADAAAAERIAAAGTRCLVISFDSDWRFDTSHSRRIVRALLDGGVDVSFREINSPWGHDSFLLTIPDYHRTVAAFLSQADAA
ncbi:homoserine O-acetyltransferase MetX [Propionibacteriaceae bacterium Y2011]|uniref:homoserine O-acetyltransferase MetX n=1 Tax=Microlunatus sp. Y2014 TaxID=3418488 RepID=UPI003B4948F8